MKKEPGGPQRIFVGDVQGCADELTELVDRARARFGDEYELWVAGDVVNRGPDNRRALELVRELVDAGRGQHVLGNHEVHLLHVALGLRDLGRNDSIGDVLGAPDAADDLHHFKEFVESQGRNTRGPDKSSVSSA